MEHPNNRNFISILTDGTDKNVHVFAPNGDEIKGIISVELAPIKNDGFCEATIHCYLQSRQFPLPEKNSSNLEAAITEVIERWARKAKVTINEPREAMRDP